MSEENKYTFENPEYRDTYRHTVSHILAQAVKRLYPEVKLAIGPSIENGFYYDFDAPFSFTQENLDALEAEMRKICKEKLPLERFELPRAEARRLMEVTKESLHRGIAMAQAGNRIGDISHAVQSYVEENGFSVVRSFVGHGVGKELHEDPEVPNFGNPGRGPFQ